MATITTHTLDGTDGSHASRIAVCIRSLPDNALLAEGLTDEGGRLSLEVPESVIDPSNRHEMIFDVKPYWQERGVSGGRIIPEIVLRFDMPDPSGQYHMPVILSPFSFSTWTSD